MSILDTLKPKAGAKPPSAAQIEQQLPAQRERVIELETAIGQAALDALTGDQAAINNHRRIKAELMEAHDKLALLNQAHAAAIERDRAQLEAQRDAIRKTQRESCRRHLASVTKDAEALAASLANAVQSYQAVMDHVSKAHAATPIGAKVPDNCLAPGRIRQLILAELFKLSAPASGPSIGRDSMKLFPGASSPDVQLDDQPEAIPPFVDQVRKEIDVFTRAIREQAE
jgi:hypothetical protein